MPNLTRLAQSTSQFKTTMNITIKTCRQANTNCKAVSGTFLQTLPELVTPLKRQSLSPRRCPPMSDIIWVVLQTYCRLSIIEKLFVSWQFFETYDVINYGGGWGKDVVNKCLECGAARGFRSPKIASLANQSRLLEHLPPCPARDTTVWRLLSSQRNRTAY